MARYAYIVEIAPIKDDGLPPNSDELVSGSFRAFLRRALPEPWQATRSVFDDYLDHGVIGVLPFGDPDTDMTEGIGISGSSRAGEAEISSRLCAHWARLWHIREPESFDEMLKAIGVVAVGEPEPESEHGCFLPAAGYAVLEDFKSGQPMLLFDRSRGLEKVADDVPPPLIKLAQERGCCCQLCAPTIDPEPVEKILLDLLLDY